ncbi:MAG: hypothetical protein EBU90_07580 [Proteobacteria bacterium]|nr:hypothetical protein [Pseudomonadota bacterium]NBP13437.1 hypothetical protein [bacterium]
MADLIEDRISALVSEQMPEFIRANYSTFVEFIRAYYKFLEQDQSSQELFQNFSRYTDVDKCIPSLIKNFYQSLANDIPTEKITADKTLFLKNARDLYKNKGTEKAYDILFRILYNETVDYFYPFNYVIKPSDGKIVSNFIVRLYPSNSKQDLYLLENTELIGSNSNNKAVVTNVVKYYVGSNVVYEAKLDAKSITGDFHIGEQLYAEKKLTVDAGSNIRILANAYPVVNSINFVNRGKGYSVGEPIGFQTSDGVLPQAKVFSVNDIGEINQVIIINPGLGFTDPPYIVMSAPQKEKAITYKIRNNVLYLNFDRSHGLEKGNNLDIVYSGNIFSLINGTIENITIDRVVNYRTVSINKTLADTSGNAIITYSANAYLTCNVGTIVKSPRYYLNNDGKLSENMYLQGPIPGAGQDTPTYYQPFSYVIKSKRPIKEWRDYAKKIVHPAGFALLGEVNLETELKDVIEMPPESGGTSEIRDIFAITADKAKPPWFASMTQYSNSRFTRAVTVDFTYLIFGYFWPPPYDPAKPSSLL